MPKINQTFEKGMIKQYGLELQPKGSYNHAENIIQKSNGTIETEKGTTIYCNNLPEHYIIMAHCILGKDIIVLLGGTTNSLIGSITDGHYTQVTPAKYTSTLGLTNKDYGNVNIIGKIGYNKSRIIYIADGKNTSRALEIDKESSWRDLNTTGALSPEGLPSYVTCKEASGTLPTGMYQFAARFYTSSNVATNVGLISNPFPVIMPSGFGAEPGTASSTGIALDIHNIDSSYAYVEPIVITRIGTTNTLTVHTLDKIAITPGLSSAHIVYGSTSQNILELTEQEIRVAFVNYDAAKYLCQKDGHLLLSGLTVTEDSTDWQEIANHVKLRWFTEDVPYVSGFDISATGSETQRMGADSITVDTQRGKLSDYRDPMNTAIKRGYKRNEVYSFTFTPIFKDGTIGNAYHIPSDLSGRDDYTEAKADGTLGIAKSTAVYPQTFGRLAGTPVKYHRMPETLVSPPVTFSGNTAILKVIGIEATVPDTIGDIAGYIIGREVRTEFNSTILGQGLLKPISKVFNGGGWSGNQLTTNMLFGGCRHRLEGRYDPSGPGDDVIIVDVDGYSTYTDSYTSVYMPDMDIDALDPTKLNGLMVVSNSIQEVKYANTTSKNREDDQDRWDYNKIKVVSTQVDATTEWHYAGVTDKLILAHGTGSVVSQAKRSYRFDGKDFQVKCASPCVICKTTNGDTYTGPAAFTYYNREHSAFRAHWHSNKSFVKASDKYNIPIVDIRTENDAFYGIPTNQSSVLAGYALIDSTGLAKTVKFFGGDTFICKVGMTNFDRSQIPEVLDVGSAPLNKFTQPTVYQYIHLFIETSVNYNYLHELPGTKKSVPLLDLSGRIYGKDANIGAWNYDIDQANRYPYNKQYSSSGDGTKTYSASADEVSVKGVINRTIYSSKSIAGELTDSYRIFKPNDYHDIPYTKGMITGIFVHNGILFHHTEYSLWRSSFNDMATQATSIGEVVLGNGGAFNRPSVEMSTLEGGYAGCQDPDTNVQTPIGRIFLDKHQRRLFALGEGLKDLTTPPMREWFLQNLSDSVKYIGGYDIRNSRYMLTCPEWTLSYSLLTREFTAFHSYTPITYIAFGDKTLMYDHNAIHELGIGEVGNYFGTKFPSKLRFVVNDTVGNMVLFNNIEYTVRAIKNSIQLEDKNISKFKFYNDRRNTNELTVIIPDSFIDSFEKIGEITCHKVDGVYRAAIPQDMVKDVTKDVLDPSNLLNASDNPEFRPYMSGGYLVIEIEIDNTDNTVVELKTFKTEVEPYNL